MTPPLPEYTLDQVNKHNNEGTSWVVIEGYVCDITTFLPEHPGGREIMLAHLGSDATEIFAGEAVHSHSPAAFRMLAEYRIGILKSSNVVNRISENNLNDLVDVSKPIIPQIPKLGAKYNQWIHSQYGLKKIIIFDNFLESFTRWPWWYIFFMWGPFVGYMLAKGGEHLAGAQMGAMYLVGLLSWSIVEYGLHRFVFHMHTTTTGWNYFHFFAHGIHHLTPNDSTRLTFPPTFSALIALGLLQVPGLVSVATGIQPYLAGLATGFVLYDTAHYYFHHGDAPWLPAFLQQMKTSHLNHHYKDDYANFGVSSPLFDWVFGTLTKPGLSKPLQAAS